MRVEINADVVSNAVAEALKDGAFSAEIQDQLRPLVSAMVKAITTTVIRQMAAFQLEQAGVRTYEDGYAERLEAAIERLSQ